MVSSVQSHTAPIAGRAVASAVFFLALTIVPAHAQEGSLITSLQDEISSAARGWEQTVSNAARSLFWILASIEIGLAAIWLALQAPSLQEWFAALVRRILFVGFFALVLDQGPSFAKAVVDSLFQIGASGGNASPADIFNAGLVVAGKMAEKIRFGLFEDNALAISAAFATIVVVIAFSLVAAIFVAIMAEMYIGLLAGMIMLGLGGSSFTKDFAIKYLVYAFSVGMKLMALVMIARIGSQVLIGLANRPEIGEQFQTLLAIAGIAVVVFVIAIYVPNIIQGVIQGVSVGNGMEVMRHGGQAASFAAGAGFLVAGSASAGMAAARSSRAGGASMAGAILSGMAEGVGAAGKATALAMKDKAIEAPGSHASSLLGLANAKLDQGRMTAARPSSTAARQGQRR
ncbi:P-type conjugative transfer protein TrbL [Rhizobium sp. BK418]|uniref:P-type conjugative transfer protein TrbL n=1 Tax=Rhizobium sp. BK418 TaxID=2512120 RepID=UPI00104B8C53|nr:P-type conjugative transfer protein TrbL [Rhizobium sp. BK418]TCR97830.1 type IV secretion system protein TrbL [Rhizobium sp. BK418]